MSTACPECFQPPSDPSGICTSHGMYCIDVDELVHLEKAPHLGLIIDGRYALVGRVGAGGFGTVYRARQLAVGRDVALKVLKSAGLTEPAAEARFQQEAQVIAALESDHTVPLYDFGRIREGRLRGATFMAMQLVKGVSLAQRLARGALPIAEAVLVMDHVADSLDEAHARGIVHRDLKPPNLLLTAYHGRPRVKVIDFGIARVEELSETGEHVTLGTPSYMAPEMWRRKRDKPIDGRVDVYAMGVVLFQMLTGHKPHTARELVETARWHLEGTVPSLADYTSGLEYIDPVIRTALAKNPDDRYPTVGAMAADLQRTVGQIHGAVLAGRASLDLLPAGMEFTPSHPSAGFTPSRSAGGTGSNRLDPISAHRGLAAAGAAAERAGRSPRRWGAFAVVVGLGLGGGLWLALDESVPGITREPDVQTGPAPAADAGGADARTGPKGDGGWIDRGPVDAADEDAPDQPPTLDAIPPDAAPDAASRRTGETLRRHRSPPASDATPPKPPVERSAAIARAAPAEPPPDAGSEPQAWPAKVEAFDAALAQVDCARARALKNELTRAKGVGAPPRQVLNAIIGRYMQTLACQSEDGL